MRIAHLAPYSSQDSNKHLRPVRTFFNTLINILRPVRTFCNTLINILRPVRTFCNVNCTFGTILFTRPVRTFCNVNCTFGTILFTSSQDSNKHFETR
ncbi:unnamed protein product [Clavelina lepadiformis]|uniref:Uncharacterized protein n=1 Tax=Clavelina lepadiformis TaxID=159417 RepID=A0ABP0G5R5_CLALP